MNTPERRDSSQPSVSLTALLTPYTLHQHADFHHTQTLQPGNTNRTGPCASPATQVLLLPSPTTPEEASILSRIAAAEEAVYHDPNDPRVSMDVDEIIEAFQAAGLGEPTCRIEEMPRPQLITRQLIDRWFSNAPESFANALERHGLAQEDIDWFRNAITSNLLNQKVNWHFSVAFVSISL